MSAPAKTGQITAEEFFRLVPDGQKADLLDGEIVMASPDTPHNDDLAYFVRFPLRGFSRARKLGGKVQTSRVAFVLSETRAPEPDVAYVSEARRHLIQSTRVAGAPDIAVEIVSPESVARDYEDKKRLYEEAGVREYWIVNPLEGRCDFYRLRDGRYEELRPDPGGLFHSETLPGFWLKVDWLLADPLPDEYECLDELLGS